MVLGLGSPRRCPALRQEELGAVHCCVLAGVSFCGRAGGGHVFCCGGEEEEERRVSIRGLGFQQRREGLERGVGAQGSAIADSVDLEASMLKS